ncbi:MAG: 1-acyl-sn-glycerol-3-phosphate acyltransferase [Gemmatimonadaceae bacterium]|nr:1-acyl-sn-glycerol-3-phosphate acyltransferase [Gemmatimonadaceae bacterium]
MSVLLRDRLGDPLPPDVRATLAPLERLHFEIALRMNREPIKGFWTQVQRWFGALAVRFLTRNLVREHGFAHVEAAIERGPVLLVANHRTYFDMFIVSSLLHRRLRRRLRLYFPVVGQYYYQSVVGMVLNQVAASWSMFPPLFALPTHGASDRYALDLLCDLCARGPGTVLGIHPEGGRNLNPDRYSFMRFQPGTGRIIHAARPIVVPVFIAGLSTHLGEQVRGNWRGGEDVRVWFGAPVDLDAHHALPGKGSTYKAIVDEVMAHVRGLAEQDRTAYHATGG